MAGKETKGPAWYYILIGAILWTGLISFIGYFMVYGNSITSGSGSSDGPMEEWSPWSPCSPTQGTRSRIWNGTCTINCAQEEEECVAQGWSGWTRCSNRCGSGITVRRWECGSDVGLHCDNTVQSRQRLPCISEEFCDFGKIDFFIIADTGAKITIFTKFTF